jgi:integrase
MSVRKRVWTTRLGERKEAWVVDYTDGQGDRHIKTFTRKKDADAEAAKVKVDVGLGVHTAPSKSVTLAAAAEDWIRFVTLEKREAATIAGYQQHIRKHIVPRLGATKIAALTTPRIERFRDDLLADMSRPLAKKVLGSLKAILKDAKRRGNVAQNVAADVMIGTSSRDKAKPKIGRDIPTTDEIRRILDAAPEGRGRALIMVAAFSGLRASELRGLRWEDVNLKRGELHVRQRADRFNDVGQPKSASGERVVPIGPMVVNTLRQWKLKCPKSERDLVFPTGTGGIENHSNIVQRMLAPAQIVAGVIKADRRPKYPGLHSLRHFYASWCINRRQDGGLELPPKTVQARLGHASIVMTLDRYGHLFPSHDDGAELAEAERAIFAT